MKDIPVYRRDLKFYIEKAFLENKKVSLDLLSNFILKEFKRIFFTPNDEKLIRFATKSNITQRDFDEFIEDWDIEKEGGHKALMLSYFMKEHPEIKYPEYIEPRLKGLLQYYKFRNLKLLANFKRVCTRLKREDIKILILKGGAMRYFRPEFPRFMGDIDILVPEKDYETAKNIAGEMGYTYTEYGHSIDLYDSTKQIVLDIHHKVDMISKSEALINEDLYNRAKQETVFSVDGIYVPCIEDMLFVLLINLSKNLIRYTSPASILYTILDCQYIANLKNDFDWNIVKQNAVKTKTESQLYIAIRFINEYLPDKLPELFEKEFNDSSVLFIYNEWFLKRLRNKSHKLNIKEIFKPWWDGIKNYLNFRPQYILYKRRTIRENANMAKAVLENQRLIK